MKSTMTKMMALLEKTSLDQRKPYNDTDSVRSLISQISLYSDMVQDIMPVIQEKDTEDPLCLLDRSSGRRASTISLIEEKSSSTLPSPPSFTAFYDESPNIMEEVNVSSIQVQKHKSYDKLNEKEDTNIKAEVSSKIDEKMKFFDNLSKIPLIRGGDTEKMNNLDSLMVKKSTILEGVSEDSLLPVSKQRQVFEREAMKAMFEEVSIQKQVPGKVGGHKESDISNKESKLYKILFIGSSSAGKTSIIRRYVKHTFTPSYRATIGADFLSKVIHWDEAVTLRLQLWDIAGQDRFSLLSRSFYKDAVGAFIVCDISRPDTLDACIPWKEELDAKVQTSEGGKLPCFLLANKCDLVEDSTAQSKLTSKVCQMHGFHGWMQTSAKEDINITQAIEMLLRQIVKQDIDSTPFATDQESLVLENEGRKKKRSGCLC
uniref:Ras-related protein Rab-32 n=2 Tax=Lepeophtheirus salmonis TaxID=72036 RepID=D3PIW8_LEPSM|nr:Ras-related protein Rab-32 [Lepeophtheirus salmonis]